MATKNQPSPAGSTRQVAKATPRAAEPNAESVPAASDAAEPAEESGQTDAKAAQPNRAAVNDSVAFPDETLASLFPCASCLS